MKICVVGTGYVGLVSAACFAEMGNDVHCVDVDENVVRSLNEGRIHIFEPGLEDLVKRSHADERLFFSTDLAASLEGAAVVFMCVGTPSAQDGSCDLSHIMNAARSIGLNMNAPLVVVDKSTVPVGTADAVHSVISEAQAERGVSIPFYVVSNPEFLKEGDAVKDFMKPDRIILGTGSEEAEMLMRELYAPFAMNKEKILLTSVRSAEMIKYAANGMLATKISFINEIAQICEHVGADVRDVRTGIGSDHRIGPHFIYPGLGYGGSCFPKDVRALIHTARTAGLEPELLVAVDSVNNRQKRHMAERILEYFDAQGGVAGKTLALWGLAFKANTDDMRESPVIPIVERLCKEGMRIRAFDPVANDNARKIFAGEKLLHIEEDQYGVLDGADALLLATEWNQFRTPDFKKIKKLLKAPVIFDGRNLYSGNTVASYGFAYFCIGRR